MHRRSTLRSLHRSSKKKKQQQQESKGKYLWKKKGIYRGKYVKIFVWKKGSTEGREEESIEGRKCRKRKRKKYTCMRGVQKKGSVLQKKHLWKNTCERMEGRKEDVWKEICAEEMKYKRKYLWKKCTEQNKEGNLCGRRVVCTAGNTCG